MPLLYHSTESRDVDSFSFLRIAVDMSVECRGVPQLSTVKAADIRGDPRRRPRLAMDCIGYLQSAIVSVASCSTLFYGCSRQCPRQRLRPHPRPCSRHATAISTASDTILCNVRCDARGDVRGDIRGDSRSNVRGDVRGNVRGGVVLQYPPPTFL